MNKNILSLLILLTIISLTNFSYAQGCDSEGWKGYGKIHQNKTISLTCPTCTFINITVTNPSGTIFISNDEMTDSGGSFDYTFLSTDLNEFGTYQIDGYSNLDDPLALCFDITINGKEQSVGSYIFILFLILLLFVFVVMINFRYDEKKREVLYKKIVLNYLSFKKSSGSNNFGNVLLYLLAYGLLKSLFVIYYLVILVFLVVLTEFVDSFSINSLSLLSTTILNIYFGLSLFVALYLFLVMFEIIKSLGQDSSKMLMGVYNGK